MKCAQCGGPVTRQSVIVDRVWTEGTADHIREEQTSHRYNTDCICHLLRALRTIHKILGRGLEGTGNETSIEIMHLCRQIADTSDVQIVLTESGPKAK